MSHLEAYRNGLARLYRSDVLMCASSAQEAASRNGLPLTVALRILVPHYADKGYTTARIAAELGVSERTVQRHRIRAGRAAA